MSWLSNAWDSVSNTAVNLYEGAGAAIDVIMDDPGHAAAVFVDGLETGVTDIGGLIIGGVPDLVNWGSEKLFDTRLYDGSLSTAVSEGMMWAVDGAESLVGIEKPVITGEGDQFLFGAGRLTGQVTAGTLAIANAGTVVSALGGTLKGSWTVASGAYKAASVASTVTTTAVWGGGALVGADMTLNDGRVTAKITKAAVNAGVRAATDHANLSEAWEENAPDWAKDMLESLMQFAGNNPMLAKWGSFALSWIAGSSALGMVAGEGLMGKIGAPVLAGAIAWGISEMFTNKALEMKAAAPETETPVPAPVAAVERYIPAAPVPALGVAV